jgi:hypothetical protein
VCRVRWHGRWRVRFRAFGATTSFLFFVASRRGVLKPLKNVYHAHGSCRTYFYAFPDLDSKGSVDQDPGSRSRSGARRQKKSLKIINNVFLCFEDPNVLYEDPKASRSEIFWEVSEEIFVFLDHQKQYLCQFFSLSLSKTWIWTRGHEHACVPGTE